jgi:hypothetical protein
MFYYTQFTIVDHDQDEKKVKKCKSVFLTLLPLSILQEKEKDEKH